MTPKTINAKFQEYMDATYPGGLPENAKLHVRQAFFSGVMAFMALADETKNDDDCEKLYESIMEELKAYAEERGVDLGGKN